MTNAPLVSNTQPIDARYQSAMFIWMLALAVIWHHTSSASEIVAYWLQFDPIQTPGVVLACTVALIAACYPYKTALVGLLALVETIVIALRMPFVPTHAFMEMLMFFGIFICYLGPSIRYRTLNPDITSVYENFAPLGRWLLIVMYFFVLKYYFGC